MLSVTKLDTDNAVEAFIRDFYKDSDGFMWMASPSGIARFDGHQFRLFNTTNSSLRGLLSSRGRNIAEDGEGYIWVIGEKTTDLLHHSTFEVIPFEEKFSQAPFVGPIENLNQTPGGFLVFKSIQEQQFYSYHKNNGFHRLSFIPPISDLRILAAEDNYIWVSDQKGGYEKYEVESRQLVKSFQLEGADDLHLVGNRLGEDVFYRTKNNQLIFYTTQKEGLAKIFVITADQAFNRNVHAPYYLPEQDIFVARFPDNQFYTIDLGQKTSIPIEIPQALLQKTLGKGEIDDQGIIWLSNRREIHLLEVKTKQFRQYPPFRLIRGFWLNQDYLFTASTKTALRTGEIVQSSAEVVERESSDRSVESNLKEECWFGGKPGIVQLDTSNLAIVQQFSAADEAVAFWSVLRDQRGTWWGGTVNRGLFYKSISEKEFVLFNRYNGFEKAIGAIYLLEDGEHLWAATKNGLYLIHHQRGVVARYAQAAKKGYELPFDNVFFIYKEQEGIYWVSSAGGGIVKLYLNDTYQVIDSKHFTIEDGLPSNTVYCIVEDDQRRLWMSTYNGIVCMDTQTENVQIFRQADGLYESEFNRNAYAKGDDGRIYFGSMRGITGFHPDEVIKTGSLGLPIFITQYAIYNKGENQWVDRTNAMLRDQAISLQPSERFFKLSVSMLDFFNAQNLRYTYKIEGLLEAFQPIKGNTVEISGLPYGRHQLRVRGQGADGRYSEQELVLPIIVIRPFYLRWWFISLVFLFVVISVVQFYFWRIQQLQERRRELELMVKERTAQIERDKTTIEAQAAQLKELDQLKSRFFANISHELRTPLTLLLSPLEGLLRRYDFSNRDFTTIQLMRQNGEKLLKRINELLDLSRLDANKIEVQATPTYLYPFLRNIIASIDSAANAKEIQLLFEYHLNEELQVLLDIDKFEKIFFNYLSNALKFTPKKGRITIAVQRIEQRLQLSVSDTGVGIPAEDLNKIFDRFYQAAHSKGLQGTGIGLALCKELAKVLDGEVWAESTIGTGSTFYLQLPLVETFAVKAKEQIIEDTTENTLPTPEPAPSTEGRSTILVVEDNADLRQYIESVLQSNYQVQTAEHGQAALDWLKAEDRPLPALLLSDIMMP
ncbi:MAG: ATP-binding protein, partial [Bacteroidota bacterium]